MSWVADWSHWLRELVHTPVSELRHAHHRRMRFLIDLGRHCWLELRKNRAAQAAAALTYHTLFSLFPMVVLMFVLLQGLVGMDTHRDYLRDRLIDFLLPTPADEKSDQGKKLLDARETLRTELEIRTDALITIDFRSVGVIGLFVFFYGATGLLGTLERTFNRIYEVDRLRPLYLRLPMYYTIISLGPAVMIAGNLLKNRFIELLQADVLTKWLTVPMIALLPLVATWLVFFALFMLIPNTRVNKRAAAVGSLFSAICFVISQASFSFYVSRAAVTALYPALALLPLFLLWMWMIWLIVLFGLELTYTLQTLKGKLLREEEARKEAQLVGDPQWLIPMMLRIAAAFDHGKTVSESELAQTLRLPARSVHRLGDKLETEGLVNHVDRHGAEGDHYSLAVSPDKIPVTRLIDLAHAMTTVGGVNKNDPGWQLLDRLAAAEKQAVEGMTLRSLLKG